MSEAQATEKMLADPPAGPAAPPTTQIAEYNATAAGLADLRSRLANVVYDVSTTPGMDRAKKDRRECITLRTSLESLRVNIKAPALERCRLIDAEAKALNAEIVALEGPIDEQIKKEEARKEAERQARLEAERRRVDAIRTAIAQIQRAPIEAIGKPLEEVRQLAHVCADTPPTEAVFQELYAEAKDVWDRSLAQLRELLAAAERNAIEAKRLADERTALEVRQREQQEREAAERKRVADEAAAAESARHAEEAAAKVRRDEEAATERKRLDDEARAARARRDEEDRIAREARERADREAAEARAKADQEAKVAREAEEGRQRDIAAENERKAAELQRQEEGRRAAHVREVTTRLTKLRGDKAMGPFIAAALEYRNAAPNDATEKLVVLLEIYAAATAPKRRAPKVDAEPAAVQVSR